MSLCIGGVCVPYTAIVPLAVIVLKWIATKLADVGLLPRFLADKLGIAVGSTTKTAVSPPPPSCCASAAGRSNSCDGSSSLQEGKKETESCRIGGVDGCGGGGKVENVDTTERWNVLRSSTDVLIVKFTAEWCKPCKVIQPAFVSLSSRHSDGDKVKFVTVDVDHLGEVAESLRVAMMPTFVALLKGVEVGQMNGGSDEERLKIFIEKHVAA